MNYGYVKVAASVPRVRVADCKFNAGQSCALPDIPVVTFLPSNFCLKRLKWG